MILYDDGKLVGEISDWNLVTRPPEYKMVLGKEILSSSTKEECTFVSPKPVTRKSNLTIKDGKTLLTLKLNSVKGGTMISATVLSKKPAT